MATLKSTCPVCDGTVTAPADTEISEIITCGECDTRLVVESKNNQNMKLTEAPEIEEDWGE